MNRFPLLVAPWLVAPLAAQTPLLETLGPAGIYAKDPSMVVHQSVAKGTKIDPSLNLQGNTLTGVRASTQVQMRTTDGFVVVTIADRGAATSQNTKAVTEAGTTPTPKGSPPVRGANQFLLTLPLQQGAHGRVRVRYSGLLKGGATARAVVDIGNDGRIEFQANAGNQIVRDYRVLVGAGGLKIRIASDSGAKLTGAGLASYEVGLVVIWIPEPACTFKSYGANCGPTLAGSSIPTPGGPIVKLSLSNAPKASPVGVLIGARPRNVRIPGSTCYLLVDYVIFLPFFTTSNGTSLQVLGSPPSTPVSFYAQDLILDRVTLKLVASQGLFGDCR